MSGFGVFTPKTAGTILVGATASSVPNLLTKPASATVVRIRHPGTTDIVYVAFGTSAVAAAIPTTAGAPSSTPASMPISPGETVLVGIAEGVTHVAVIAGVAGPTNIFFTVGNA
jgi:hypothetical protein